MDSEPPADLPWDPPTGLPSSPPAGPGIHADPTSPDGLDRPGRLDRGGATLVAAAFGGVAGLALPPVLYWPVFAILRSLGSPDVVAAAVPLVVAFGAPILLLRRVRRMLRTGAARDRRAASALTMAATVALSIWLLITVLAAVAVVIVRTIG